MTDREEEELSLEARLTRLESILARMESEEVDLDEALQLFEEGVGHVREAERVLAETELRVEELLASGETRELEADGVIGSVADHHYSLMGAGWPPEQIEPTCDELARTLHADAVTAVCLVPV